MSLLRVWHCPQVPLKPFFVTVVGADEDFFKGSDSGMEAIMRIMDVVGVSDLQKMEGEYVRVATQGWGSCVKIIGNIVAEKWFDYESFFDDKKGEKHG